MAAGESDHLIPGPVKDPLHALRLVEPVARFYGELVADAGGCDLGEVGWPGQIVLPEQGPGAVDDQVGRGQHRPAGAERNRDRLLTGRERRAGNLGEPAGAGEDVKDLHPCDATGPSPAPQGGWVPGPI